VGGRALVEEKIKPVASNIFKLKIVLPNGAGAAYQPSHSVLTFISEN
jgi:hypothetical protein